MACAMGQDITIDNFKEKMVPITSTTSPDLFALVDMGSNGIRFSISDLSPPRSRLLPCIYKERAGISLYDALHSDKPGSKPLYFSAINIALVSSKLAHFATLCRQFNVPSHQIQVFATEAMRTALNREDMLSAIKTKSGLTVDILAPKAESLFGSLGARSGFDSVQGLFMDLGGGSVQMTWLDSKTPGYEVLAAQAAKSMPFGAARLSEALQGQDADDTIRTLKVAMKTTFQGMCDQFPLLKEKLDGDGVRIYFCGGGFRGYGSMLMHTHDVSPYPIPAIGGFLADGKHFKDWKQMLKENGKDGKVFGMSQRRRDQFPAIATVVEALVDAVENIKDVTFCSGGNREGVLYMKLSEEERASNPLDKLAATDPFISETNPEILHPLSSPFGSFLPTVLPKVFSPALMHYCLQSAFTNQGESDDDNSAYSLHHAVSGSISTLPGLTHEIRAIISLTLSARWGNDLGPMDQVLVKQLQKLIGEEFSWWCQYVGAALRFLGTAFPAGGRVEEHGSLNIEGKWVKSGLGKKGKKNGVLITIISDDKGVKDALEVFDKVGKGLDVDWKVEYATGS